MTLLPNETTLCVELYTTRKPNGKHWTLKEISDKIGVSQDTIKTWLRTNGYGPRSRSNKHLLRAAVVYLPAVELHRLKTRAHPNSISSFIRDLIRKELSR